eukprot:scaffold99994_cov22-Tisochrysis_lutea.AAC.1
MSSPPGSHLTIQEMHSCKQAGHQAASRQGITVLAWICKAASRQIVWALDEKCIHPSSTTSFYKHCRHLHHLLVLLVLGHLLHNLRHHGCKQAGYGSVQIQCLKDRMMMNAGCYSKQHETVLSVQ